MKKIYLLTTVIALTIMSCTKDQELTPNPNFLGATGSASFSANVDGASFKATSYTANIFDGRMSIVGTASSGQRMSILLDKTTTGIYKANASGSNLLQYETDTSKTDEFFSSFFSSSPLGTIEITSINQSKKTISGTFSGTIDQSSVLTTNPLSAEITNGSFANIPYETPSQVFNFGFYKFSEDGTPVTMNTATASKVFGSNNGRVYSYFNLSSGTADFSKSIAIEIDSSRLKKGLTTNFDEDYSGPFDGALSNNLANAYYSADDSQGMNLDYDATSGSVTVTDIKTVNGEEKISGTFIFEGSTFSGETISLSNGEFEAILR